MEGKLNLDVKEIFALFIISWLVAIIVLIITALGLAQANESGIMPLSIFIAGVASYFYAKKNILKIARKKNA